MRTLLSEIIQDTKALLSKKSYSIPLFLTMALSYATLLHNPTVGIDDTSFGIYYEDGVSPAMGRWCLFLINKIFPLDYNPFFVETVGLLLFCVSVTLWCVVFFRMFGEEIPTAGYALFSCVMISCPIISEVVVWYVQDGIYLGYGFTALAVLCGAAAFRRETAGRLRSRIGLLALSTSLLTVALGFYEAFMIVFLMGMAMVFFLTRALRKKELAANVGTWFVNLLVTGAASVALRTLIVAGITAVFHLEDQAQVLKSRGLYEVLGWFDGTRSFEDFTYVMKDFFVKYYVNAAVYLPVTVLVLAVGVLGVYAVWKAVRLRDGLILASAAGIVLIPWILPVLEGTATYYRSSQYIPLLTAFSALLLARTVYRRRNRILNAAAGALALVLLYNQAYEMNKWLYVDAMKYEDTKRTLDAVALTILERFDPSKPICIVGEYQTPPGLVEEAYCPPWSRRYAVVSALAGAVDERVLAAYDTPYGYAFAETPRLSFLQWGAVAFYGFDREIIKFWKMHGFTFTEDGNLDHYRAAREQMKDGPVWPAEGSVVELEDHIVVNFGIQ